MKKIKRLSLLLCLPMVATLPSCGEKDSKNADENKEQGHTHSFVMHSSPCAHWGECECGETYLKEEHKNVLISEVPANCKEGKISHYECSECHYETVTEGTERLAHKFTKTLLKEATCQEKGQYKYRCSDCNEEYLEEFENKNAHHFNAGATEGGITTYSCDIPNCTHSYQVISAKEQEVATVKNENLASAGAIELKEATIALDSSTLNNLGEDVTIGAEKKTVEAVPEETSEETLELIKDAPIFDFSMKNGDLEVHELGGTVKITVPYTLKVYEDPKNISVAYINDEGEVEHIRAEYASGNVSFETDHFSLYAVVQLSPEEACEKFGHTRIQIKETDSTCAKPGVIVDACTRCGEQFVTEKELAEHYFVLQNTVPATYNAPGKINYICTACGETKTEETPQLVREGDNYVMTLAKSVLKSNIHLTGVATGLSSNEGQESKVDVYFAPNYKEPYIVTDRGEEQEAIIGGYNYSFPRLNTTKTDVLEIMAKISAKLENTPETFTTVTNIIGEVLEKVLFTKTSREGKTVLSLDFDKVNALVNEAKNNSITDLLSYILDEDTYSKVYSVVENFYDRTVKQSLDALKAIGIDVKEVMDFISYFVAPGNEGQSLYDSIFTPELLATTGDQLGLIPSFSEQGSPMSKDEFLGFLDSLKGVSLLEMLGGMAPVDIFEMVEGYVDFFKNAFKLEVVTSPKGQFESANMTMKFDENNPFGAPTMEITMEASTVCDAEAGHMKAKKIISKMSKAQSKLSMANYVIELEKYLAKQYPGIKFTFIGNDGNPRYESNTFNVKYNRYGEKKNVKGRITLEIAFGREIWYNSFTDPHNMYGKKNSGLMSCVDGHFFFSNSKIEYFDDYNQNFDFEYNNLNSLSLIYDPTTDTVFTGRSYGHLFKYETPVLEGHHYRCVGHCVICGQTESYSTSWPDNGYEGRFFVQGMNDEALKYDIQIQSIGYYAYNRSSFVQVYEITNGGYNLIRHDEGTDRTYNFGNVTIAYTYKKGPQTCSLNENIKFYVDNKLVLSIDNKIHEPTDVDPVNGKVKVETTLLGDDGCCTYTSIEITCKECGEIISQTIEESTHHDMQVVKRFDGNEFYPGYVISNCNKCGMTSITTQELHRHNDLEWNYETGEYYCEDCGKVVGGYEHYGFREFDLETSPYSSYSTTLDRESNYYIVARDFSSTYPELDGFPNITIGLYNDDLKQFTSTLDIGYVDANINDTWYSLLSISKEDLNNFLTENSCSVEDLKICVLTNNDNVAQIYDMPSLNR